MLKMKVMQCAGCVSANTKLHQLCWGDREWVYYMSCAHSTAQHWRIRVTHCINSTYSGVNGLIHGQLVFGLCADLQQFYDWFYGCSLQK